MHWWRAPQRVTRLHPRSLICQAALAHQNEPAKFLLIIARAGKTSSIANITHLKHCVLVWLIQCPIMHWPLHDHPSLVAVNNFTVDKDILKLAPEGTCNGQHKDPAPQQQFAALLSARFLFPLAHEAQGSHQATRQARNSFARRLANALKFKHGMPAPLSCEVDAMPHQALYLVCK